MPGLVEPLLAGLLPDPVACAEAFTDPPGVTLFPEEEAVIARAVQKRRNEFTTARHCARTALGALGVAAAPILPGPRGAPTWPPGIVGSMTHCDGYRAAAVAPADRVTTIGLDAEPNQPLPDGVLRLVGRPEELPWLAELAGTHPDVCWDRLLFSAKETVYKGWFPLAQRWLGFEDAIVTVEPDAGTFEATIVIPTTAGELTHLRGRWLVRDGLILTAAAVATTAAGGGGPVPAPRSGADDPDRPTPSR